VANPSDHTGPDGSVFAGSYPRVAEVEIRLNLDTNHPLPAAKKVAFTLEFKYAFQKEPQTLPERPTIDRSHPASGPIQDPTDPI
jgi:hypothetical protein